MSDKYYVGADLIASNNNGKYKPISRVTLAVDDYNVITAGDDTGFEISASCPYATQQMADALLQKLQGYVYQAFEADEANLNPSAELGDGATAGGIYGTISKIRDDGSGYVGISAPGTAELEDEYPMDGPLSRMVSRQIAGVRSAITKTAEEIRLEVFGEDGYTGSSLTMQLDKIRTEVIGELYDENGNPISVASAITQTAKKITSTVSETIGDLGEDESGEAYTVASKIEQTAESITLEVSGIIGDLGKDENGDPYTVASKIQQTAEEIALHVEGYFDTDEFGRPISVSSSIEAALGEISLSVENGETSSSIVLKVGENEQIGTIEMTGLVTFKGLEEGTTTINGGWIETDSIYADALHLGGMLSVYKTQFSSTAGGYLGYDSGFLGKTGGIGVRSSNEFSQMVCTDIAARLSYSDDGRHVTQVVCGQELALSSVTSIQFSVGGNVNDVVAGIDSEAFYPADASLTLGTVQYPWADVYVGNISVLELLGRVEALEKAAKS